VRPLEVAEIMLLDPSTVTRLVEKLQSKSLVTRKTQGRTSPGAGDPYTKFNPYCGFPIHATA
jgi:predicted transcriptional regulator